jgi:hypothetical protein
VLLSALYILVMVLGVQLSTKQAAMRDQVHTAYRLCTIAFWALCPLLYGSQASAGSAVF